MGNWQKWLSSWAKWWNITNQSQPNPLSDQMDHPVETECRTAPLYFAGARLRLDRPPSAVGGGELLDVEHQHLAAVVAHERGMALGLVLQQYQVHLRGVTACD